MKRKLSAAEFDACRIILNAAHHGMTFDAMCETLRQVKLPEWLWRPFYQQMGFKVRLDGDNRYVYAPGNLVAFPSKSLEDVEYRQGGSAACDDELDDLFDLAVASPEEPVGYRVRSSEETKPAGKRYGSTESEKLGTKAASPISEGLTG